MVICDIKEDGQAQTMLAHLACLSSKVTKNKITKKVEIINVTVENICLKTYINLSNTFIHGWCRSLRNRAKTTCIALAIFKILIFSLFLKIFIFLINFCIIAMAMKNILLKKRSIIIINV